MAGSCSRCARGRKVAVAAYQEGGVVGLVRSVPNVMKAIAGKEPNIRRPKLDKVRK